MSGNESVMDGEIDIGKHGEKLAADHLLKQGYVLLEKNWKCGREEIDIIARHGNFIVVVEVKTRTGTAPIEPSEVVPRDKQKILVRTANAYMRFKKQSGEVRFDIITIQLNGNGHRLDHLTDAFFATMK